MDLTHVSTSDLERLRSALAGSRLSFPITRFGLQAEGIEALADVALGLTALGPVGALAVVDTVLAERGDRPEPPELVWTGPESRRSGARDTAVVLASLFLRARTSVLLAGFAFDHASEVLSPLHGALLRGVSCRIFADQSLAEGFLRDHWPFGPPFPEVYGFAPERGVFASLHAKCVVVDGRWALVTSANFTDRGQTRNIEVGVLLDDGRLAATLEAQFVGGEWFARV